MAAAGTQRDTQRRLPRTERVADSNFCAKCANPFAMPQRPSLACRLCRNFSRQRIAPGPPVAFGRDATRSVPSTENEQGPRPVFPRLLFCAEEFVVHDIVCPAVPLKPSMADRPPPTSNSAANSVHQVPALSRLIEQRFAGEFVTATRALPRGDTRRDRGRGKHRPPKPQPRLRRADHFCWHRRSVPYISIRNTVRTATE